MQPAGRVSSRRASLAIVAVGWLSAPAAGAHIDLLEPEARAHGTAARNDPDIDVNSSLKIGPCGQVRSGRTDRVATYAPGQHISVRVREENAHVSYLRVSIDLDGESFPIRTVVPAAPETQEAAQAAEDALGGDGLLAVVRENNDVPGFVHEIAVTLPETSCTNCTLQVIQFMYDDPAAPYYFQCADLVITDTGAADAGAAAGTGAAGATGSGTPVVNGGSAAAAAGGAGGLGVVAAPPADARGGGADARGADAPPAAGTAGSGSAPAAAPARAEAVASDQADDKGGCYLSGRARGSAGATGFALFALALAFARRRR
jgi:hypothetical protein